MPQKSYFKFSLLDMSFSTSCILKIPLFFVASSNKISFIKFLFSNHWSNGAGKPSFFLETIDFGKYLLASFLSKYFEVFKCSEYFSDVENNALNLEKIEFHFILYLYGTVDKKLVIL